RRSFTAASSSANLYAQVVKRLWPRKSPSRRSTETHASFAASSAISASSAPRMCGRKARLRATSNRAARTSSSRSGAPASGASSRRESSQAWDSESIKIVRIFSVGVAVGAVLTCSVQPMKLGALVWPQYTDWESLRDTGAVVDRLGYDSLWTWDHLYPIVGDPEGPIFEGYLTLAGWAGGAEHVTRGR